MTEEIKLRSNRKNLTGQKFGKLTVIKPVKTINDTSRWLCKCECGNEKVVATYRLLSGRVKTCGDCFNTINFYIPECKRLEQERDELKKTVENQKLEYEELQCDLSEVENACGCYQSENAELKQENKELKSQRDEARIAYNDLILDIVSDIPFEGEIGGERFISIKDRLHQMQKALASLEEIREILLLPDMPEVKERTIITSTILDEIVRANRENKLQKIKQTIYEVLNLS